MTTGVVSLSSDLVRKKWMREGLIQAASKSFWSPLTGGSKDSVVYQENNISAGDGHTVVFDYDGNLSGKAIKGKTTAAGKGEGKRKFSNKITVERYRLVADNGDIFDGVNIGDLSIPQHADSRAKLGDLWVRFKDQAHFDAAQGNYVTNAGGAQSPSHVIDLGTTFAFNSLLDIEKTLRTSTGFGTGSMRRPLDPVQLDDNEPMWIFVIDSTMANMLRKDTSGFQTIMNGSDVRGSQNRNIRGVIGRLGALLIVEAGQFFGATSGTTTGWTLDASEIEIAGLRQYDGAAPASALWTGQTGFNFASANLHSRGLLLGKGALQFAMGKQPDYKFQTSQDFSITSESALECWMEVQKTKLTAENQAYKQAKVESIDYGIIAVDVEVQ